MDHHPDPQPGLTVYGRILTQETVSLSSRGDPVTQATEDTCTGGPKAFTPRTETGIRRRTLRQDDSLNELCLAISSEQYPIIGDQRPPPTEISVEEDASTKNFQKVFTGKEVVHIPPNDGNAEDSFPKPKICPTDEKVANYVQVFTDKKDTGNGQNISKEDNSTKDQTDDITTNFGKVPSLREGDQPPAVVNNPINKVHQRKDVFTSKMVTEDTDDSQNISTDDIPTSVEQVSDSENSLREEDKPPQVENIPTDEVHKRKDVFPRKMVIILFIFGILVLFGLSLYQSTAFGKDVHTPVPDFLPGDFLVFQRYWGLYHHCAIYIRDGYVVHLTGGKEEWLHLVKGKVKKEKLVIKPGDHVQVVNGKRDGKEPLPTEEIIKRAESQIGKKGYNWLTNNCEHFVNFCLYGIRSSRQANNICLFINLFISILFTFFIYKYMYLTDLTYLFFFFLLFFYHYSDLTFVNLL